MKDGRIGVIWKPQFESNIYKIGLGGSFSKSKMMKPKVARGPKVIRHMVHQAVSVFSCSSSFPHLDKIDTLVLRCFFPTVGLSTSSQMLPPLLAIELKRKSWRPWAWEDEDLFSAIGPEFRDKVAALRSMVESFG